MVFGWEDVPSSRKDEFEGRLSFLPLVRLELLLTNRNESTCSVVQNNNKLHVICLEPKLRNKFIVPK